MSKKKISLSDIAKSLGVSKTLVSMVINNLGDEKGINKKTQARVWKKVKELNYKPNMMARGLRLGRSNMIGLIVSDISNAFYAKIARHIESLIEPMGYNIMICSSEENMEKEARLKRILKDRMADGIIIATSQIDRSEFQTMLDDKYPFVLIDRFMPDFEANSVTVDNFKGSYDATSHLLQQGYKNIAALAISPTHISTINDRIEGYLQALNSYGITYDRKFLKEVPFNDIYNATKKELAALLSSDEKIDAIYALNNIVAYASLEFLNEHKYKIPEDIAFICFDDPIAFKFYRPTITAVFQPLEEIAKNAVEILMNEIKHKGNVPEKKQVVLPTTLMIRRSTVR